jgi:large subunit ribosomal protein L14
VITVGTYLQVSDNSGAKIVQCIKILHPFKKQRAIIGDTIIVSLKQARMGRNTQNVLKAIVVETKKATKYRKDGSYLQFDRNAVVLINNGLPIGTRILGCVTHELRKKRYLKIVSMAPYVI